MKTKRKYNPNKIAQIIQSKSNQVHDLWMFYDNNVVDTITNEWLKYNPKEEVPTKLLYPHIKGDLIIAIKHRLIDMNQKWYIRMRFDLSDGTTAEIDFDLPRAHLGDIKRDTATFNIDRGNGIKTRWKGLDSEIQAILKPLESEGLECLRTMAYIRVKTPFKSAADYSYFVQEKTLRLTLGENVV